MQFCGGTICFPESLRERAAVPSLIHSSFFPTGWQSVATNCIFFFFSQFTEEHFWLFYFVCWRWRFRAEPTAAQHSLAARKISTFSPLILFLSWCAAQAMRTLLRPSLIAGNTSCVMWPWYLIPEGKKRMRCCCTRKRKKRSCNIDEPKTALKVRILTLLGTKRLNEAGL